MKYILYFTLRAPLASKFVPDEFFEPGRGFSNANVSAIN